MYNKSFVFRSESHIVSLFDYQAFHIMARNIRRTSVCIWLRMLNEAICNQKIKIVVDKGERHRSREFVLLLKKIDEYYPKDLQIRLILDNHSAHISKETMGYLATRPNRFIYIHTPKHGVWLNLIETFFVKISRAFLRNIQVQSKQELRERILKGIEEINAEPLVHQWRHFDFASTSL